MEFVKYYKKVSDLTYRCTVHVKTEDAEPETADETECSEVIKISKESFWNLKRHMTRKHPAILHQHNEKKSQGLFIL